MKDIIITIKNKMYRYIYVSAPTPIATDGYKIIIVIRYRHIFVPGTYDDNSWIVKKLYKHFGIRPEY